MSVYKNPKDGSTLSQMPKIATNIEMVDAPQENYVTQEELVEAISQIDGAKQYTTMPTASIDYLDSVVQYTGENGGTYVCGFFYQCKYDENNDVYYWDELSVDGELVDTILCYNVMPIASENYENSVAMYIGTTDSNYTHGYTYECVSDGQTPATYSWEVISGGGSDMVAITTSEIDAMWE